MLPVPDEEMSLKTALLRMHGASVGVMDALGKAFDEVRTLQARVNTFERPTNDEVGVFGTRVVAFNDACNEHLRATWARSDPDQFSQHSQ